MDLADFYSKVEEHPQLAGKSIQEADKDNPKDTIYIEFTGGNNIVTAIPVEAIEKADWETIEEVLTIKRDPQVLYHMTRVVGYYSRIENWNKSKIGELHDRQKGNYSIV